VVSDVVDAVKHMGTNIMTIWEERKTNLGKFEECENKFFVRMKDKGLDDDQMFQIKEAFGDVLYVKAPDVKDELAFITTPIKEGDFAAKLSGFEDVYSVIRVDF
jgi:homoserine dehydrogenase